MKRENGYRRVTDRIFDLHKFQPSNVSETNDGSFLLGMLKNGGKITLFPRTSIISETRSGEIVPLKVSDFHCEVTVNVIFARNDRNDFYHDFLESLFEIGLPEFERLYKRERKTD